MARFDVYAQSGFSGFLLDCQSDLLTGLNTRFVVPLLREGDAPRPIGRLNPRFCLSGESVVMVTQFGAAVALGELSEPVASLRECHDEIVAALDMLISGF
jgi:toxin CcdB